MTSINICIHAKGKVTRNGKGGKKGFTLDCPLPETGSSCPAELCRSLGAEGAGETVLTQTRAYNVTNYCSQE